MPKVDMLDGLDEDVVFLLEQSLASYVDLTTLAPMYSLRCREDTMKGCQSTLLCHLKVAK